MLRKVLQWFGLLCLLALVGGSLAALLVVKDRIRVEVALDRPANGPDPLALVRDDVATLQRDLAELRSGLAAGFEQLGKALDERAEERHAALLALKPELAAAQQTLARQAAALEGVAARAAALEVQIAALAARPTEITPAPAPAPAPVQQPAAPPAAPPGPTPQPNDPPPATPPAPKKPNFLSFSVPQTKFQFTEPQDYVLVPELCRVGFDAKSTLHDFTGVTTRVSGRFRADFDDPRGAWTGEVACEAKSLATGVEGRDTNLREYLDTEHQPQIRFELAGFEPGTLDVEAQKVGGTVVGRMTIRGKTHDVRMPVQVSVDASRRVVVEGQMPLKLSDYGVEVPSQLGGAITMEDEVKVWIALRARMQQGGTK